VDIAVSIDSVLTIAAGDTLHFNGDTFTDHTVNVNGTLIGFGTVTGSGGALDTINLGPQGLIEASSSHNVNLHGNVAGSGTLELTNNTSMEIGGSVASTVKVLFDIGQGAIGTLVLDDPQDFHATITGSGSGNLITSSDIIDLKGLAYTGSGISVAIGTTQTVITVGTSVVTLAGNYTGHSFVFSSDGSGGTQFHDPPATTSNPAVSSVIMNDPGPATDTVVASAPNQTLTGLGASDTFVFNFGSVGNTTVANFHPETDLLQFKSSIFASAQDILNATHVDGHGNAVIVIDTHDSITLDGVARAQLHTADFHIV
jgi:hypothetical protein